MWYHLITSINSGVGSKIFHCSLGLGVKQATSMLWISLWLYLLSSLQAICNGMFRAWWLAIFLIVIGFSPVGSVGKFNKHSYNAFWNNISPSRIYSLSFGSLIYLKLMRCLLTCASISPTKGFSTLGSLEKKSARTFLFPSIYLIWQSNLSRKRRHLSMRCTEKVLKVRFLW